MQALYEVDKDTDRVLPVDPFGSKPHWASLIPGLGGSEPAPNPTYVFETLETRPALGAVCFCLKFSDIRATMGTLLVEVKAISAFPGMEPTRLQSVVMPLQELVDAGGEMEISIESRRNTFYLLSGTINDETDLAASGLSIIVDRRATKAQHGKGWGWRAGSALDATSSDAAEVHPAMITHQMTDLGLPSLAEPVSQVATARQFREPCFDRWMDILQMGGEVSPDAWSMAYLLQAIETYGPTQGSVSMLAFAEQCSPLISHFASRGYEVLAARQRGDRDPDPVDPGAALEALFYPALCDGEAFYDHAHFATCDIRQPPATFFSQFDIMFSVGMNRQLTTTDFINFAVGGLAFVKPGGLAVHVFDYVEEHERKTDALDRHAVERLVAMAISYLNDAAKLRFRHGEGRIILDPRPFGIVLRRGGVR